MATEVLHLAAGHTVACTSFRPASGYTGWSLMDYHMALAETSNNVRPCKSCYPHYLRRLKAVNQKRVAKGKLVIEARDL